MRTARADSGILFLEVIMGLTIFATAVTVVGFLYGLYSDWRRRTEREWIHAALVLLKPSIQGPNQAAVIAAINNMLEFLKPPKKTKLP